ncbi:MAG: glycoside hydrolase family 127 protein [Bacteroidaceae bacterium]|nr:glycoside hydrolase family 127 protein [Bacteroidaceae bacterium]
MRKNLFLIVLMAIFISCETKKSETISPVAFTEVQLTGGFWQPRMQTELDVTVPFSVEHSTPAVERFRRCAAFRAGEETPLPEPHRFISSDLYKVMEGVAYSLMLRPDAKLEAFMDSTIALIAASQMPDGYLYISHICGNTYPSEMGPRPYSHVIHSHELYNMGHLYEAAVAYYQATGKTSLLDVAMKSAHHINHVFFEGDPNYNDGKPVNQAPGHEEIELALCKMYRTTDDKFYLDLAQKFLDIRGVTFIPDGTGVNAPEYAQQHLPVRDQREAVGHCVRAIYLYTGMAGVDALTGNADYTEALHAVWKNLVSSRIHITGGLGADRRIEGFGEPYSLPNKEAYDETCAAVANVFFNQSMFLAEGDARYWDVAEISLFNNALAGISLSGDRFFYENPLEADSVDNVVRQEWFGCACCPPNISRLILQSPGLMYSHTSDDIYVTLYADNATTINLDGIAVALSQTTDYPMDGKVRLEVTPTSAKRFALRLRIPTWCRTTAFMPGELYTFADETVCDNPFVLRLNGEEVQTNVEKGFAVIDRTWNAGDVVELDLKMRDREVVADARVKEDAGCVAHTRGPIVYCAETVNGVTKEIPYFTWSNNKKASSMKVWSKK